MTALTDMTNKLHMKSYRTELRRGFKHIIAEWTYGEFELTSESNECSVYYRDHLVGLFDRYNHTCDPITYAMWAIDNGLISKEPMEQIK